MDACAAAVLGMRGGDVRVLELTEYDDLRVPADAIERADAECIYGEHGRQVTIEEPSFGHRGEWLLRSNGFVGFIPVSDRLALRLQPKVPLRTLFAMLEWAYHLDPEWLVGLHAVLSVEEFYERLAMVLAKRVLGRARRGLYRRYIGRTDALSFICGRVDLRDHARAPWATRVQCDFEEHSGDVIENRILAWTLATIARGAMCSERVRPTVRRAFHVLQGDVTLQPVRGVECVRKTYDRLCEDYRPLHGLCRFFLDHAGATHTRGDRQMLPFLVRMESLFEMCVAEWLRAHLPPHLELKSQERLTVGRRNDLTFNVDLVVRDVRTRRALVILDTKYKAPDRPSSADIAQVVAYATGLACPEAALVYPVPLALPVDEKFGAVRVTSLQFDLSGDLEAAGLRFLREVVTTAEAGLSGGDCMGGAPQ